MTNNTTEVSGTMSRGARTTLALGSLAFLTSGAVAGLSGTVISIEAQSSIGIGTLEFDVGDLAPGNAIDLDFDGDIDLITWNNTSPLNITSTSGQVIAQLGNAQLFLTEDVGGFSSIGGAFAITAAAMDVDINITSGSVGFNGNPNPSGRATAGLTLTDSFGTVDGADLTGLQDDGSVYAALFNGGDIFTTLGSSFSVPAGDIINSDTLTDNFPGPTGEVPFGQGVNEIALDINFSLTAGDQASGTFSYGVPAPGTAIVLLSGGMLATRRRR